MHSPLLKLSRLVQRLWREHIAVVIYATDRVSGANTAGFNQPVAVARKCALSKGGCRGLVENEHLRSDLYAVSAADAKIAVNRNRQIQNSLLVQLLLSKAGEYAPAAQFALVVGV